MRMNKYLIIIALSLAAGCTTPNRYGPTPQHNKKLDSTKIQAANFNQARITEVFSYFSEQSALQSPNGEGILFVFPYEEDLQKRISANIVNSRLSDAIRTLCASNALLCRIDGDAVYVNSCIDKQGPLSVQSYKFPLATLRKFITGDPTPEKLTSLFVECGIPFYSIPWACSISYDSETQLLTAINTSENLARLGELIVTMQKRPPAK
jgi:hypothetical protein